MKTHVLTAFVGLAAGLALALSCSGGGDAGADAHAACDCDPAEAPLAGRIQRFDPPAVTTIVAGGTAGDLVSCPGATLLSGGCVQLGALTGTDLAIQYSGVLTDSTTWSCAWKNNGTEDATASAFAICLVPPDGN